jgi:hypothetical protein
VTRLPDRLRTQITSEACGRWDDAPNERWQAGYRSAGGGYQEEDAWARP